MYYRVEVYLSHDAARGRRVKSRDLNMWTAGAPGNIDPLVVGVDRLYATTATGTAYHTLYINHVIPSATPNPLQLYVSVD